MTRIKFFTVILLAVMGGFILSAPSESWAAEKKEKDSFAQNDSKEKNVKNWIAQVGRKAAKQTSANEAFKENEAEFKAVSEPFASARDSVAIRCWKSYLNQTIDGLKGAGDDFWDAAGRFDLGGIWDALKKAGIQITEGAMKSISGQLVTVKEMVQRGAIPDCVYDYSSSADSLYSLCSNLGVMNDSVSKQIQKVRDAANKVTEVKQKACILENAGADSEYYEHCELRDSHGKKIPVCLKFMVNTKDNTIITVEGATQGCMPLPYKLYEARSCLFCPMFKIIFDTIQTASTSAMMTLGDSMAKLLLIGLAIWIAFMVLKNVSAMTKQDAPKFLNDIFRASFKILIIYILLTEKTITYGLILGPLLKAGFEFGISFLSYSSSSQLGACEALANVGSGIDGVLPLYVYNNLLCFIEAVQYELATSQAIGSSLMCVSTHAATSSILGAKFMPDFTMMLQGALIYIISFILSLAFGFYLIDATIQRGIFGMVLPFLLMCWPFKVTNSYFGKGVGVFMNSWFIYVFMGIVVNISLTLIGQGLTGGKGGLYEVEQALNGSNVAKLQELLSIGFAGFLVLVACCVFGVKLMMKVQDLAGTFSGGGLSLGIGNKIGGLAAAAGTGVAKNTAGLAGRMGKSALNAKIFGGKDGQYHSVADSLSALKSKAGRAVGRGMQGAGRTAGKAIGATGHAIGTVASTPVRIMRAAMRGLNRRQP